MAQEIRLDLVAKVDKALKDLEELKDGIDASAKATKDAAKATEDSAKATKSASKATKALGKSFKGVGLAMKAAGIGLVMALFSKLKEVLEQNQTVMDLVSTAMNTISVVFNEVSDVVTDVYDSVTKSSEGFEGLGKVLSNVMTISLLPMKAAFYGIKAGILALMIAWEDSFLGGGDEGKIASLTESLNETKQSLLDIKDEGLEAVKNIGDNIAEAITEVVAAVTIIVDEGKKGLESIDVKAAFKTGGELTKLRNEVKLLDADAKGLMLTYQTQAELQRQIRDDESATIAQRVAANDELGRILDEQLEKETELAQKKVDLAQLESDLNADNIDLQIALKEAKTELIDINERIIGQESEQMTNQVALGKELLESQNELSLIGKSNRELELEELEQWYKAQLELARKSGADTTAIEKSFAQKKLLIAQGERDAKLAAAGAVVGALGKLAGDNKAIAVAGATIDTYAAIAGQLKAFSGLPIPGYAIAQAVATGLVGLANVKKILDTDVPGDSGGGGGSVPSIGGNLAASIPAATGLGDVVNSVNAQGQQPVEAFVISQTVTDSQEAQSYINNQRTL
tara:strand:- start:284 stop:1999 length:1716 start_codon:yes stop_codon:yes gene_type:complete